MEHGFWSKDANCVKVCLHCRQYRQCWEAAPLPGIPKQEKGNWYCQACWEECNVPIAKLNKFWEQHCCAEWEDDLAEQQPSNCRVESRPEKNDPDYKIQVACSNHSAGTQDIQMERGKDLGISTKDFTRLEFKQIIRHWDMLLKTLIDRGRKNKDVEKCMSQLDSKLKGSLHKLLNHRSEGTESPVVHFLARNWVYDEGVMYCLLEYEADINVRNVAGRTALQCVVDQVLVEKDTEDIGKLIRNSEKMVRTLIQCGADPADVEEDWFSSTSELQVAYNQETIRENSDRLDCISRICSQLIEVGVELPWHPDSLMKNVQAVNVEGVNRALGRLGDHGAKRCLERQIGGRTLLHRCAVKGTRPGCPNIVAKLLQHHANVNATTPAGSTPLDLALNCARPYLQPGDSDQLLQTVKRLVESRADLTVTRSWRTESIMFEQTENGAQFADLLMDNGADLPWHAKSLKSSVMSFDVGGVQSALKRLGDNARAALDEECGGIGGTLLHFCGANADKEGAGEIVELLVRNRALVTATTSNGQVPLDLAVACGSSEGNSTPSELERLGSVTQTLVRAGVAKSSALQLRSSQCMLSTSVTPASAAISEVLLESGIDLPWHPLSLLESVKANNKESVMRSLKKKVDQMNVQMEEPLSEVLDSIHSDGNTLLHLCAANAGKRGSGAIASALIQHGASVNIRSLSGQVPLEVAVDACLSRDKSFDIDVVKELLIAGALEEVASAWSCSSCELACAAGPDAAELKGLLLDAGADLPWHPGSLQSRVGEIDIDGSILALKRLSPLVRNRVLCRDAGAMLQQCAVKAGQPCVPALVRLLTSNKASFNTASAFETTPLTRAVSSGIQLALQQDNPEKNVADTTSIPSCLHTALDTIEVILEASSKETLASAEKEWHSSSQLAALGARGRCDISGLLMKYGVNLAWHPQSAQRCVYAADLNGLHRAFLLLGERAGEVVQAGDSNGRTLLHICAEVASKESSSDIVNILLEHAPDIDALDDKGYTPLAVAISTGLSNCSSRPEAVSALGRTVTALKCAGASIEPKCSWNYEHCPLVVHYGTAAGREVLDILKQDSSTKPEWVTTLEQLNKLQVPLDTIGACNALWIHRERESLLGLGLDELKDQCRLKCLKVPEGNAFSTLRTLRDQLERLWVEIAKAVVESPEDRLIGIWCYRSRATANQYKNYEISLNRDGKLIWQERHEAGILRSVLQRKDDTEWLYAKATLPDGMDAGDIRFMYNSKNHQMLFNSWIQNQQKWGKNMFAHKSAVNFPELYDITQQD